MSFANSVVTLVTLWSISCHHSINEPADCSILEARTPTLRVISAGLLESLCCKSVSKDTRRSKHVMYPGSDSRGRGSGPGRTESVHLLPALYSSQAPSLLMVFAHTWDGLFPLSLSHMSVFSGNPFTGTL